MSVQEEERAAIEYLATRFQSDGFEVISSPAEFRLGSYIPDLVLRKNDDVIIVEVKHRKTPTIEKVLERLREQFESKPNQQFKVFYLDQLSLPKGPKVQTNEAIDALVSVIETTLNSDAEAPAFLASWAAFEAASRRVFSERFARPQSPGRLITILTEEGILLGSQAASLRELSLKRNKLIHGELDIKISPKDVTTMIEAIRIVQHYSSPPDEG